MGTNERAATTGYLSNTSLPKKLQNRERRQDLTIQVKGAGKSRISNLYLNQIGGTSGIDMKSNVDLHSGYVQCVRKQGSWRSCGGVCMCRLQTKKRRVCQDRIRIVGASNR